MRPTPPPFRAAASRAATAASRAAISRAFASRPAISPAFASRPAPPSTLANFLRGLTLREGLELFGRCVVLGCASSFITSHLLKAVLYNDYEDRKLVRKKLEAELQKKD